MSTNSRTDTIHFYWDPGCPWAYVTSRWVAEVARMRGMEVRWRLFSLRMKNQPKDGPAPQKPSMGLRALRVAAAVQQRHGDGAVGALYAELGRRRHAEKRDIGERAELEAALDACGLDRSLADAADDEARWNPAIERDMAEALSKAGDDVGVPLIVLDDGDGPAFFGPVISEAPKGDDALRLWETFEALARTPGLYELKRGRDRGPVVG